MSESCPFCGFEGSGFRKSHNWCCHQCGKDYADWLLTQKASASAEESAKEGSRVAKKPLFSQHELPPEAEPVKFAQSLFVLAILALLGLSLAADLAFSWVYPVSIPLAGYYAWTIHKTGYALGQNTVYSRDENPIIYKLHLWGVIGYIVAAFGAWLT